MCRLASGPAAGSERWAMGGPQVRGGRWLASVGRADGTCRRASRGHGWLWVQPYRVCACLGAQVVAARGSTEHPGRRRFTRCSADGPQDGAARRGTLRWHLGSVPGLFWQGASASGGKARSRLRAPFIVPPSPSSHTLPRTLPANAPWSLPSRRYYLRTVP